MNLKKAILAVSCFFLIMSAIAIPSEETKKKNAFRVVLKAFRTSGPDEAIKVLKQLVQKKENYKWKPYPFIGISNILIHGKQIEKGIEFLEILDGVFENPTDIHIAIGEAYILREDKNKAKKYYTKVLRVNPNHYVAKRALKYLNRNITALKEISFLEMKFLFDNPVKNEMAYLGQPIPGLKPKIFAPNLISRSGSEVISLISDEGRTIWFGVSLSHTLSAIMATGVSNGKWTHPKEISFSKNLRPLKLTHTKNRKKIFFSAVNQTSNGKRNYDIWYVEKSNAGWSDPKLLPSPVNSTYHERHPHFRNGKLFFTSNRPGSLGGLDIFYSEIKNGEFLVPVNLGPTVNSKKWEWDIAISPDETYLILGSNRESPDPDSFDLFVSFKADDNSWTQPVNMGPEINSSSSDLGVVFSPDGKYIFYHSGKMLSKHEELGYGNGKADIYWVDTKVIDQFRKRN